VLVLCDIEGAVQGGCRRQTAKVFAVNIRIPQSLEHPLELLAQHLMSPVGINV